MLRSELAPRGRFGGTSAKLNIPMRSRLSLTCQHSLLYVCQHVKLPRNCLSRNPLSYQPKLTLGWCCIPAAAKTAHQIGPATRRGGNTKRSHRSSCNQQTSSTWGTPSLMKQTDSSTLAWQRNASEAAVKVPKIEGAETFAQRSTVSERSQGWTFLIFSK
jgi:hypothetical protein